MSKRTCLVTGGGTGFGLAITRRLASYGDDVVIVGRRPDVLTNAAEDVNAETGRRAVSTEVADLTDPDAVAALAERLPDRLDVVVHNAGGNPPWRTTPAWRVSRAPGWTPSDSTSYRRCCCTSRSRRGSPTPPAGSW